MIRAAILAALLAVQGCALTSINYYDCSAASCQSAAPQCSKETK